MSYTFASATILLLLITDPLGNIPIFANALRGVAPERRARVILREVLIAFALLLVFLFFGAEFLRVMNLSDLSLQIAGAVVLFLGTTRQFTAGRETASLDYECYADMARRKLEELETQARERWPLVGCAIVHRVGHVPLGDASVAIAVSSPHRREAFEAGQWLIDTLKQIVPIWKREHTDEGADWVGCEACLRAAEENAAR